ncbi:pyridoxamine 5'-phosphate oxidase family protein [Anaerovorax odorimutans]|uniref:Pyridoxamine 5'-phosphate oxidase family protein n=1 Tax=Anaerovorax odorimutans TaxID=109327 RepID=A0ABT1RJ34_9FIRM|nr:pyridoxamine 5'-phosphate oxidase family protein [Anaerovorax odorimutans]MCQ4635192.1 pyridoxamine 5'-phosphate oxidase family protein [Anaerovorax odorimutans]
MFREMRLKEQQLSEKESIEIIKNATHATLAINGADKYPYSVPISHIYSEGKIYFHGATSGQKFDLLTRDPHVSISVIAFDDVQPAKFTTFYKSVIAYGDVRQLKTPEEIKAPMRLIIKRFCPGMEEAGITFLNSQLGNFYVYEMDIKHMTGKQSE